MREAAALREDAGVVGSSVSYVPMRRYAAGYAALGAACFAGVLLYAVGFMSGSVSRWSSFAVVCREGVALPALFAALAAALLCRQFDAANVAVGRVASRDPARIWAYQLRWISSAALLGYAAGLLPLAIRLARRATWGGPDMLAVVDGCMALCFLVALAMTLGILFTGRWKIVIVPVLVMLAMVSLLLANEFALVDTGRSSLLFSPVWNDETPYLGYRITMTAHGLRILFYAVLVMLNVWVSTRRLRGDRIATDPPTWIMTAAVTASIALSMLLSPLLVGRTPFIMDCKRIASGSTLCLHPADDSVRGEITAAVNKTAALLADGPTVFSEYVPNGGEAAGVLFTIPVDGRSNVDADQLVAGLVSQLIMPESMCAFSSQSTQTALGLVRQEADRRLGAGDGNESISDGESKSAAKTPGSGFTTMNDDQFTTWLGRHRTAIRTCAIKEDDLP